MPMEADIHMNNIDDYIHNLLHTYTFTYTIYECLSKHPVMPQNNTNKKKTTRNSIKKLRNLCLGFLFTNNNKKYWNGERDVSAKEQNIFKKSGYCVI